MISWVWLWNYLLITNDWQFVSQWACCFIPQIKGRTDIYTTDFSLCSKRGNKPRNEAGNYWRRSGQRAAFPSTEPQVNHSYWQIQGRFKARRPCFIYLQRQIVSNTRQVFSHRWVWEYLRHPAAVQHVTVCGGNMRFWLNIRMWMSVCADNNMSSTEVVYHSLWSHFDKLNPIQLQTDSYCNKMAKTCFYWHFVAVFMSQKLKTEAVSGARAAPVLQNPFNSKQPPAEQSQAQGEAAIWRRDKRPAVEDRD